MLSNLIVQLWLKRIAPLSWQTALPKCKHNVVHLTHCDGVSLKTWLICRVLWELPPSNTGSNEVTGSVCSVALSGGSGSIQTTVTRGDPENKEREEAEAERKEAEGDREPQAPGQCPCGAAEPRVCRGAFSKTRRCGGKCFC